MKLRIFSTCFCSAFYGLISRLDSSFFIEQKRVFRGKSDPCGTVHITIGDGGNSEGLAQRCVPLILFPNFILKKIPTFKLNFAIL